MALTTFQRSVCRLLAQDRTASSELLPAPRLSRDVDLFHDTERAVDASWTADRKLLEQSGFQIRLLRERGSFVEAEVRRGLDSVLLQWVRDKVVGL